MPDITHEIKIQFFANLKMKPIINVLSTTNSSAGSYIYIETSNPRIEGQLRYLAESNHEKIKLFSRNGKKRDFLKFLGLNFKAAINKLYTKKIQALGQIK